MNVLRTPCEFPLVANLIVHYIEQGKMEPLMAYILAHICTPGFNGGHSIMDSAEWGRAQEFSTVNIQVPKLKEVVRYTIKVHKLLTQSVEPLIMDGNTRWSLSNTIPKQRIRFSKDRVNIKTATTFDVSTRSFKEK